jgi:hypothetical protein
MLAIFMLTKFATAQTDKATDKLPVNTETKLVTYTNVVTTTGLGKGELYDKAFVWLSGFYKNPADVLREKDRDAGTMLIKARFKIFSPLDKKSGVAAPAGDVQYSLILDFKEGKFRYTLTEINWKQASYYPIERWMDKTSSSNNVNADYYLQQTDENCKKVIADLVKTMTTVAAVKKDDW